MIFEKNTINKDVFLKKFLHVRDESSLPLFSSFQEGLSRQIKDSRRVTMPTGVCLRFIIFFLLVRLRGGIRAESTQGNRLFGEAALCLRCHRLFLQTALIQAVTQKKPTRGWER